MNAVLDLFRDGSFRNWFMGMSTDDAALKRLVKAFENVLDRRVLDVEAEASGWTRGASTDLTSGLQAGGAQNRQSSRLDG